MSRDGSSKALRRRGVRVGGAELAPGRHELSLSVPDAGDVSVQVIVGRRPGPMVFVMAGVRGEDAVGRAVGAGLAAAVSPGDLAGTLLIVGQAALPGESLDGRFPRRARQVPHERAERLAAALHRLVVAEADAGIEIRDIGETPLLLAPHALADPRDERAQRLASAFGPPVVLLARGSPGSLVHAARAGGVPVAVVLVPHGDVPASVEGLVRVLARARLLPERTLHRKPPPVVASGAVTRLSARQGGWATPLVHRGALVDAGQPLVLLCDADGAPLQTISAPARAFVLAITPPARHEPGDPLARLVKLPGRLALRPPRSVEVGWCEYVGLPDLGIDRLRAKIDTGARTSALHVAAVEEHAGDELVLRLPGRGRRVRVRVVDYVVVRDSGGHDERRAVIETRLALGPITRRIRLTLTNRGDMQFAMLVGRTALGQDVVVLPGVSHLLG